MALEKRKSCGEADTKTVKVSKNKSKMSRNFSHPALFKHPGEKTLLCMFCQRVYQSSAFSRSRCVFHENTDPEISSPPMKILESKVKEINDDNTESDEKVEGDHWDEIEEIYQMVIEEGKQIKQGLSEMNLIKLKRRSMEQLNDKKKNIRQTNIQKFFK